MVYVWHIKTSQKPRIETHPDPKIGDTNKIR